MNFYDKSLTSPFVFIPQLYLFLGFAPIKNGCAMNLPPYVVFPVILSNKVVLRSIEISDIKDIVEISYYDAKSASNEAEALAMLQRIEQDYENGDSIHWGIAIPNTDKIVGTCGYYRGFSNGCGELGCVLRPGFRGQGYMTAAMQLAIDFGFNHIGIEKITAITSNDNEKAIQLLNRLMFIKTSDSTDQQLVYSKSSERISAVFGHQ